VRTDSSICASVACSAHIVTRAHALPHTSCVTHMTLICFSCSALTEKITAALPRMACPHRLEPHQIQGLDFIHIYPVVQVSV